MKFFAFLISAAAVSVAHSAEPATKTIPSGVMVDAAGIKIGHYYPGYYSSGLVLARLNGRITHIGVVMNFDDVHTFLPHGIQDDDVYYTTSDCTGQAYVYPGNYSPLLHLQGRDISFVPRDQVVSIAPRSNLRTSGECVPQSSSANNYMAADQIDLGTLFAKPYVLR